MSLLEDACTVLLGNVSVHLVHDPKRGATYTCLHCSTRKLFSSDEPFVHASDCPTRSMPKVIAALEEVQTLLDVITVRKNDDGIGFVAIDAGFLAGLRRAMRDEAPTT